MSYRRPRTGVHELLALLCALAWTSVMHAQPVAPAFPEPLLGMPRVGESCKNQLIAAAMQTEDRARGGLAEFACLASAVDARASFDAQTVVIDVRQQAQFQRFHIAGSANLPARSLAHKLALKSKEILLVGDGRSERELYSVCADLRRSGFASVRVLAGGMVSYLASGLPVRGQAPGAHELAAIDAAELWAEGQFAGNLLVVADKAPGYSDHLPYAVGLAEVTPAALAAVLDRHRKDVKRPVAAVVLAGTRAPTEASYRQLAASVAPVPLLFYSDSASALRHFVSTQKAVWSAQARGPRQRRCG